MNTVIAGRAPRPGRTCGRLAAALLLFLACGPLSQAAQAQPFVAWLVSTPGHPTSSGYVRIGPSPALNPTGAFTIEAWVYLVNHTTEEDCRSIAGKGYSQTWWIGQCNHGGQPVLRSWLKGTSRFGGSIPRGLWTHVAMVFNGTQRLHYINGELAAAFAETGPLATNGKEMRIGSDADWPRSPTGAIDEVRLWNVARTTVQIRSKINVRITTAQPGLVGVWALDSNGHDAVGGHHGTLEGTGVEFLDYPYTADCGASTGTFMCLNTRFAVTAAWRTNPTPGTPPDGFASVVGAGPDSGVFWFFSPDNWEVMVKVLNGCGLNNRYWVFSAALTNVFYRLEVWDMHGGRKIYFNYPGPPAPAVTDTDAFANCP